MKRTLPPADDQTQRKLLKEWHPAKNGMKRLEDFSRGSAKSAWWQCFWLHEWEAPVYQRYRGKGCPYCAGKRVWIGFNDLPTTDPLLILKWNHEKNGSLRPTNVTRGSDKIVWWKGSCLHSWQASVRVMTKSKNGCPYCSGVKVSLGFNDLESCFPISAAFWHPTKNDRSPSEVTYGSEYKAWWQCSLNHEWQAKVNDQRGQTGCPFCTGRRLLVGFNDLLTLYPVVASTWHPTKNGAKMPEDFSASSDYRAHWLCDKNHTWAAKIGHRTNGSNCPKCAKVSSAGERDLLDWLQKEGHDPIQHAKLTSSKIEVDLWLPNYKLAIEYNGVYWHSDSVRPDTNFHYRKWHFCDQEGIRLIQVWEDDWKTRSEVVKGLINRHLNGSSLSFANDSLQSSNSFFPEIIEAENDYSEASLYEKAGFERVGSIAPAFKYVFQKTRYDQDGRELLALLRKSSSQVGQVQSDKELLHSKNVHRIWDSGKTILSWPRP